MISTDSKVVFLDFGFYLFAGIFAGRGTKIIPATYVSLSMMLGDLRKVGLNRGDIVIVAVDKGHSWRKAEDPSYKSSRKAKREKFTDIDWTKTYKDYDNFLEALEMYSPFHVISIWNLEADDIMSAGVRFFKDKQCVIVSTDSDMEMLFAFPNVQIFSPHAKRKCYKYPLKDPYKLLAKKIKKEVADDLVAPITNEKEYEIRKKIVNLIELPEEIENKVKDRIAFLPEKLTDISKLPFKSLHYRFKKLYTGGQIVKYQKKRKKKSAKILFR